MESTQDIEDRREQVLQQLRELRALRRGTINEQFLKTKSRKTGEVVLNGPYYVLSRKEGKKTISRRLKPGEELDQARQDVAEHKRFLGLCKELEELTEQLGDATRSDANERVEKKRRRSSSKTKS